MPSTRAPVNEEILEQYKPHLSTSTIFGCASGFFPTISAGGAVIANLVEWQHPDVFSSKFMISLDITTLFTAIIVGGIIVFQMPLSSEATSDDDANEADEADKANAKRKDFKKGALTGFVIGLMALFFGVVCGASLLAAPGHGGSSIHL